MGCIRVDKITEYLCEPLRKCLKDEDPYVRKTAAVCVAKLHDINAQLVEDQGFLDSLRDLLSDSNPMVGAFADAFCDMWPISCIIGLMNYRCLFFLQKISKSISDSEQQLSVCDCRFIFSQ